MSKIVLVFDTDEVYGPASGAMVDLFAGAKTEAEVGYGALRIAPTAMDSWLAAPFRAALEGKGTARIEVEGPAQETSPPG